MTAVRKRRSASTASSQPKHIKKARKTTKFHHYQPLEHLKQQIRLIELLPGKPGSRISIKLLTVSLNDNPEYEALSYCWGPPKPSYDIFIHANNSNENNEHQSNESMYSFTVGRNLRKALDDLRHQDRPRLIWNDAICINQKDIVEKGYQIQLMHQIYTRANVVCAWLDHNVQPKTSVFDDLENLGKGVELDDFHDPSYWYPVADIFRNEYWRRLWIQQELILAAKVDIYCRRDVFSGEQLLEFQQKVNLVKSQRTRLGGPEFVLSRYIDGNTTADATPEIFGGGVVQARINLREGREAQEAYSLSLSSSSSFSSSTPSPSSDSQSPSNPNGFKITRALLSCSLLNLFLQSCSVRMTDPRDRLYGILGLATDIAQGPDLEINYAASPVWVYAQVFRHFIHRYKSLSFLCFNKGNSRGSYTSREGFPSWMPHADVCWSYVNASRACGDKLTIPHIVSISLETLCLHVQGVKVDTIKHIDHISGDGRGWTPITEWLDQMESFCRKTWPDADSSSPLYERDDVTSLMFPWLSPKRYTNMWKLDKPDPQRRVHLIRSVLAAAQKAHQVISTGDIIRGGYTPTDIIPADVREECHPLHVEINAVLLFGTEGARVGSMARTSDVRVGDEIWILSGCRMPLVMRPKEEEEGKGLRYQVIGPAVVPGIMKGEVIKDAGGSLGDDGATIILE